jgi:hypothetical protein
VKITNRSEFPPPPSAHSRFHFEINPTCERSPSDMRFCSMSFRLTSRPSSHRVSTSAASLYNHITSCGRLPLCGPTGRRSAVRVCCQVRVGISFVHRSHPGLLVGGNSCSQDENRPVAGCEKGRRSSGSVRGKPARPIQLITIKSLRSQGNLRETNAEKGGRISVARRRRVRSGRSHATAVCEGSIVLASVSLGGSLLHCVCLLRTISSMVVPPRTGESDGFE